MKIDTNTPVADLCYVLRILADTFRFLPEDSVALLECADRLELLAVENEDLRNQNHYNRVAAEARLDCIKRLEEATQDRDKEWFQVIESILGFHPVSITDALRIGIERIKKQKQRIKRLEEAGDRLAYWYEPKELRQFDALNNWKQAKEDKP